jgi:hypothetical protein
MSMNGGGNDTQQNCILEVCCGGADSKQVEALAEVAEHEFPWMSHGQAEQVASWIARDWDLAPKGTLYAFKQAIAKYAKGPAYGG